MGGPEEKAATLIHLDQLQVREQICRYIYLICYIFQPGHSTKYCHYLSSTNTSKLSKILLVEIYSWVYATNPT